MPVELLPERGALWLENWVLAATIADVTSQSQIRPAKNLLSPHRSATWRSAELAEVFARVVFDLGQTRLPTSFALVDTNLDGGFKVQLRGSDDSSGASNIVWWDFPLYAGKTLRWYLGDPSGGTMGSGRRYWAVWIIPGAFGSYNTPDPWYEIGVVWLGEHVPIKPWAPIRIRVRDPSTRGRAYGGTQWSDPLPAYREAEVPIGGLTMPELYALKAKVRAQGPKHALLDLHAFSADEDMKRGGCLYGTFAPDGFEGEMDTPENNVATLRFEEASG